MTDIQRRHRIEFATAAEPQRPELGTVAQHFRQLVQSAVSRLSVSRRELLEQGDVLLATMIDEAAESLDHASALAHQLARSPVSTAPERDSVHVQHTIVSLGDLLRRILGGGIELQTSVAEGTPAVRCEPQLLEKVLIDLAISARDALPSGGTLSIEGPARCADDAHSHATGVCITVVRTGPRNVRSAMAEGTTHSPLSVEQNGSRGWSHPDVQPIVREVEGPAEVTRLAGSRTCVCLHLPASGPAQDVRLPARLLGAQAAYRRRR